MSEIIFPARLILYPDPQGESVNPAGGYILFSDGSRSDNFNNKLAGALIIQEALIGGKMVLEEAVSLIDQIDESPLGGHWLPDFTLTYYGSAIQLEENSTVKKDKKPNQIWFSKN